MSRKKAGNRNSIRSISLRTSAIIIIPLFVTIALLTFVSIWNQQQAVRRSRMQTLSAYQEQFEHSAKISDAYLKNTISSNLKFMSIVYANTKTDAYIASKELSDGIMPLLQSNNLISGFYTYSKPFDHFRPSNAVSYPLHDAQRIQQTIADCVNSQKAHIEWQQVPLSDRSVLLSVYVFKDTAVAMVIDPGRLSFPELDKNTFVAVVMPDGSFLCPQYSCRGIPVSEYGEEQLVLRSATGLEYDAVQLPLPSLGCSILYAAPSFSIYRLLNTTQCILLILSLCLLASIPVFWQAFRKSLLEPIHSLTEALNGIRNGQTDIHIQLNSHILEVTAIEQTVNMILDALSRQKIASYEHKLEKQHAQLQYLQLQIRPHFYLNCLSIIYSLAGEKRGDAIQELVLDMSTYLRSIFRDSTQLVPLSQEIQSVESYIRIQQSSVQYPPQCILDIEVDPQSVQIPPLTILTFVENSIKHCKVIDEPVQLKIHCCTLTSEEGSWLNVTVSDNCGGMEEAQLQALNSDAESLYCEKHIGIRNVRQRLMLLYGPAAMLSFRNQSAGLCVEIFLPLQGTGGEKP